MDKIKKGQMIGLLIEVISGLMMLLFVMLGLPIPELLVLVFAVGFIVTMVFSLFRRR